MSLNNIRKTCRKVLRWCKHLRFCICFHWGLVGLVFELKVYICIIYSIVFSPYTYIHKMYICTDTIWIKQIQTIPSIFSKLTYNHNVMDMNGCPLMSYIRGVVEYAQSLISSNSYSEVNMNIKLFHIYKRKLK